MADDSVKDQTMDLSAFAGHKLMPNPVLMTKSVQVQPCATG